VTAVPPPAVAPSPAARLAAAAPLMSGLSVEPRTDTGFPHFVTMLTVPW